MGNMHGECDSRRPEQVGSHHRQDLADNTGVTLLELLTVLVIVAVLSAVALPGMGVFSSRKALSRQADRIEALLYRARDLAMEHGHPWIVQFDPGRGSCECYGDADGDSVMDSHERRLGPDKLQGGISLGSIARRGPNNTRIPDDGISFAGNRISFSSMGSCNSGSIYLRSSDRSIAIRVLPASGMVRVWEYREDWEVVQ